MSDDLARAADAIARAEQVAVLTGAGVSAESGIPTFRGAGGLWRGRDPLSLATPEAFRADPQLVWNFYNWRREVVFAAQPNPAHIALAEISRRVPHLTLITQNVDRLHQRAGSPDVLEVHGNLCEVRCPRCGTTTDRSGEVLAPLPLCEPCKTPVRPAVVWFGESLPEDVWERSLYAADEADVLLVVGTSAVVYPVAGLVAQTGRPGRVVIEVNLEPTPASSSVDYGLYGKAGEIVPRLVPAES